MGSDLGADALDEFYKTCESTNMTSGLVHTVPVFSLALLRCGHWDHTVATPASTALNWDTPCSPGSGPCGFKFFKTTGTHQAAKQRQLIPGQHRSSFGMNRTSTVRPSS